MDVPVKEIEDNYSVILRVAQFHGFPWLENTVKELMGWKEQKTKKNFTFSNHVFLDNLVI